MALIESDIESDYSVPSVDDDNKPESAERTQIQPSSATRDGPMGLAARNLSTVTPDTTSGRPFQTQSAGLSAPDEQASPNLPIPVNHLTKPGRRGTYDQDHEKSSSAAAVHKDAPSSSLTATPHTTSPGARDGQTAPKSGTDVVDLLSDAEPEPSAATIPPPKPRPNQPNQVQGQTSAERVKTGRQAATRQKTLGKHRLASPKPSGGAQYANKKVRTSGQVSDAMRNKDNASTTSSQFPGNTSGRQKVQGDDYEQGDDADDEEDDDDEDGDDEDDDEEDDDGEDDDDEDGDDEEDDDDEDGDDEDGDDEDDDEEDDDGEDDDGEDDDEEDENDKAASEHAGDPDWDPIGQRMVIPPHVSFVGLEPFDMRHRKAQLRQHTQLELRGYYEDFRSYGQLTAEQLQDAEWVLSRTLAKEAMWASDGRRAR